jgi:pseudouridine-5'-phosphate glycosidase
MDNSFLNIHPEIQQALSENKPLVALESTIISHGMPYPQNIQTAIEVENVVRENGAVPATIAIMDGKMCVGLDENQLEKLANTPNVWKVSLRDMPYVISQKFIGATTVAATMRIASMACIHVFVTGGIGGVHRGAEDSMDISADLTEMSRTSVAVVSAGVKSILDIGRTLEYLETLGIPVLTYGQDEFPSFYSRKSGFTSPLRIDDPEQISAMLYSKWAIGLNGSVLIANPVPLPFEVNESFIENHILNALDEAKRLHIKGKDVTPFLLKAIALQTDGESLAANIALVKNNAVLGSKIAKSLSKLYGSK